MRAPDAQPDPLDAVDAWWRAANYLSVAQIYLRDNALLRRPLAPEDVKPRLLGHWGTDPALSFAWAHLNRAIVQRDLDMLYVCGPGHGGPAMVANAWLEGTYSELFPDVGRDEAGVQRLALQFSYPGGVPSHAAPETPGSINEGGELGYSLVHAFGAVLDSPEAIAACVIGDGEAETGTLAASWHLTKFLDPVGDGVVLPILNLNGYKIANPTLLARIPEEELTALLRGSGWAPRIVSGGFEGEEPRAVHERFARELDAALDEIADIQRRAREEGASERPVWPMIVLRTPKGWTGPREVDDLRVEGTWRSHQVPIDDVPAHAEHLRVLEEWLRSYRPEELFEESGAPARVLSTLRPEGDRRMSANPRANGGLLRTRLTLPPLEAHAVPAGGDELPSPTRQLGDWLAELVRENPRAFRLFGPDETASNKLDGIYAATDKQWQGEIVEGDEHLARHGQVIEVLNENLAQGLLEGYLLTGRHGLFASYEAFIHIVDSMFNQHAKWLESASRVPWRRSVSSLTYLLSSHVWRQDHNGFSHQDPGFLGHVVNKRAEIVRVYLPADANSLLATMEHCLDTVDLVNVVVAGKHPAPSFLSLDEARAHGERGLGVWDWAGTEREGEEPDIVLACAGDVPTQETLAAARILREELPELRVRVVNVVDLMRLQDDSQHPHGLPAAEYDAIFTTDKPVVFAFHGYPALVHQLTYRRAGHDHLHVRGYREEGTTTTPFDMLMLNDLDRFRLVLDVLHRVPGLEQGHPELRQRMEDARAEHRAHTREHGDDMPDVVAGRGLPERGA